MSAPLPEGGLVDELTHIARRLPAAVLRALADGLLARGAMDASAPETTDFLDCITGAEMRGLITRAYLDWRRRGLGVESFRIALLAALAAQREEASCTSEIVWTGPCPPTSPFRHTHEAVAELFDSAKQVIVLVTFVAKRLPEAVERLRAAHQRGVEVNLIIESREATGAIVTDALSPFGPDVRSYTRIYHWPLERRQRFHRGTVARLHAKCVLVDGTAALVTSANFTAAGQGANIELGVLIKGGTIPRELLAHFKSLIAAGDLVAV